MDKVHEITDAPKKRSFNKKKIAAWSAVGLTAFGILLLIDDKVKHYFPDDVEETETPEN